MIEEVLFKGCQAIKLENQFIKVIILPIMGGKVASLYRKDKEFELLYQNRELTYRKPKFNDKFSNYDASGFDDAFPTIDEAMVNIGGKSEVYPDHGEIWSSSFTYKITSEKVMLKCEGTVIKYEYIKTFSLSEDNLMIDYEIINKSNEDFPCIWTMHGLINCEEDMELLFPKNTKEVVNVSESINLGQVGKVHAYPLTLTEEGKVFKLNKVLPLSSNNMEKYYVKGAVEEGCCGAYYPSKDVTYRLHYDKEKLPYLGFWVTEGAYRGDYNCALEPSNGYYDSIEIARKEDKLCVIKPKESLRFSLRLEVE
jgi:galactose mutarotase-like enzyme